LRNTYSEITAGVCRDRNEFMIGKEIISGGKKVELQKMG
jgi:hypothetical protein